MRYNAHQIILVIFCALWIGCASKNIQPTEAVVLSEKPNSGPITTVETVVVVKKMAIDPIAFEKGKPLFTAVIKNDEKKLKVAYGRAVRFIPEVVQLATDLRLKNYEHAQAVLPKTSFTTSQKDFWQKVVEKKPKKLSEALCEALITRSDFPESGDKMSEEESAWFVQFGAVEQELINPTGRAKEKSEITQKLDKIVCNDTVNCTPLSDELRKELFSDAFFDQIHNMRRRDTHFAEGNYKNMVKFGQYVPYVSDMGILKLYRVLKATPFDKQNHFLRRFKSIARDMRRDTILSRSIADIILGDEEDRLLAKRLGNFIVSHSLISAVTRIENELPKCHIPAAPDRPSPPSAPTADSPASSNAEG